MVPDSFPKAAAGQDWRSDLDSALADYAGRNWQGREIFLAERFEAARREIAHWQAFANEGADLPPLAGAVMTVKACFDVAGWTASCASRVLADRPPGQSSAPLVRRLRQAGATLLAQTNMTEFAYGALGVNTHFGTPRTPLDPADERIAGGSSSGAAVSVARGYADFGLSSDTSGSARIPAAFCGVTGFKPSRGRYPTGGMAWLSTTFDVPGVIARDAALCRRIDTIVTGDTATPVLAAADVRLALPAGFGAAFDSEVGQIFDACLSALRTAGVTIVEVPLPDLGESARIAAEGGVIGAEAYHLHSNHLAEALDKYDPLVGSRLVKGAEIPAHRYIGALRALEACRVRFDAASAGFDGFILPTVPMLPPTLAELADEDIYLALNRRSFSLAEFANRLDLPSITLPTGATPVGLMLTGTRGTDRRLLSIAGILEPIVRITGLHR